MCSYSVKNCFSKYNNQINTVLDKETESIRFRKIDIEDKKGILIERKSSSSSSNDTYEHEFLELPEDVDMTKPFTIEKRYHIDEELKTLEHAKQYIIKHKGGRE